MNAYTCDQYVIPLPAGHRFPMVKYARLRARVEASGLPVAIEEPPAVSEEDLGRVHDAGYVRRVLAGTLAEREIREIGLPWSPALVERSLRSSGGTLAACRSALAEGVAVNLAGGTHHAHRDRGAGYCVFNDAAVAAGALMAEGSAARILIVDADVHHGDGTASIFASTPEVFTFSIHAANNYPLRKPPSDLDVALEDGIGDEDYLAALKPGLEIAIARAGADLAIYQAGADPYSGDALGRLSLSMEGLARRDEMVLGHCRRAGLPVAVTMGGGYAREIDETVEIHLQTVAAAAKFAPGGRER